MNDKEVLNRIKKNQNTSGYNYKEEGKQNRIYY